ncbi:hypothetical protein PO909_021703 [Leuciscus waleckii]
MAATTEHSKTDTDQNQLVELVKDLKRSNAALQAEIGICEQYISRLDLQTQSESPGRKTKVRTPERQQFLTLEQKCDVAQSVLKQMTEDVKRAKDHSKRELENYKATLEEADIHLAEVKKQDKKCLTMSAEKVIRYIEDRIRARENLIEKLHQKNTALKEMGEGLTAVDFELLKAENVKTRKRLDEQNLEHLDLKLLAGNALQALNSNKKKLQTLTLESDVLNSDIALRGKLLVKIEEEIKQAEEERNKAEALNRKLKGQLADYHVPHVLEYIEVKESHGQLQKSVKEWERKVEIAEMALKTFRKSWDKLRIAAGARPVPARHAATGSGLYGF